MKACKKYQPLIASRWFGDLTADENRALSAHVEVCAACRETLSDGLETIHQIGRPSRPELPRHFWEGFWGRLATRMAAAEQAPPPPLLARLRSLVHAPWPPALRLAAAAAIFVAGILVSRMFWPASPTEQIAQAPRPIAVTPADARTDDLLSRTKVLFIGVSNLDPGAIQSGELNFAPQRQASRQLLAEAAALRKDPRAAKDRQLVQLVDQLEMVLLQIANLEVGHDLSAVELVRTSIDHEGLLLKINIEEMKRRAAQPSAGHGPSM